MFFCRQHDCNSILRNDCNLQFLLSIRAPPFFTPSPAGSRQSVQPPGPFLPLFPSLAFVQLSSHLPQLTASLSLLLANHLKLLDWTRHQIVRGQRGRIPNSLAPILQQLKFDRDAWCDLVGNFGKRFFHVAGEPTTIDTTRSRVNQHHYDLPTKSRKLFDDQKQKATPAVGAN
jgi:hypothetical protein